MRNLKKTVIVGALSAGALLASPSNALADGGWADQLGPSSYGCYAWTTYSANLVQPHMWQQPNNPANECHMMVQHSGFDSAGNLIYLNSWPVSNDPDQYYYTIAPSTGFDGPNWYYGPWDGGGTMCVTIFIYDDNGDVARDNNFAQYGQCG